MLEARPQKSLTASIAVAVVIILLASCKVIPKDYPKDKPFVFETNINLEGNFTKDEKSALTAQLKNQLDDSLRAKTVYKLIYKGINRPVLENPPVFDSASADRSMIFMKALLNKLGYLRNTITYDDTIIVKGDSNSRQLRTTVNFNVKPNQLFRIDSVSHVINSNDLQALTDASISKSVLRKGDPFAQQLVSEELNRLVELYRENGYLKFGFEELSGVWDTLNLAILRPTIDPFDIQMLEELRRRRDSPTTDIEIRLRPGYNVDKLKKYFVGNTTIYPDFNILDTSGKVPTQFVYDSSFTFITYRNLFRKKFIAQNIYFRRGDLYNERRFVKTINRFNGLGAWHVVNVEQIPRGLTDTVDVEMYLTPANKYSFTANIEGSFNSSNSINLEENLVGVGGNVQLTNYNFGKAANRSSTTARYLTELDTEGELVKTIQTSISHSIVFPKPIPNVSWIPEKLRDNFRTNLSFAFANTDRRDFLNLTSLNAAWGYNSQWKNKSAYIRLPNIEFAHIISTDSLEKFLGFNPSLRTVFPENGLVLSIQGGFSVRGGKKNVSQILRVNFEESGLLVSHINIKALDSLFKFVKIDAEFIRNMQLGGKKSFLIRGFVGTGFAMATRERPVNPQMPFFKQFSAGGPYSMRAWGLRLLGPGSTLAYRDTVPIRFGDFQFETNAEYRFPLVKLWGYDFSSCFFTDIGNVWFLRKNPDFPDGTLTGGRFLKDLAVGIGTGLRMDFDFLKVRLDYALKVKDPSPEPHNVAKQNKWFYDFNPLSGIIQIGINYPFAF
ncbi:MAG TPA: BamA/TamA family outer membrane protein [Chitinophagaceae bacterium]|nr:BamA/TamA family outer membrane protein [Chitinophagaceae bacterium]